MELSPTSGSKQDRGNLPASHNSETMKKVIHKLMNGGLRVIQYKNALVGKFKNTKIKVFPDHQFKGDGEKGNLIQFFRLQDGDMPALCTNTIARIIKGRAYTVSTVWLSDEAIVTLHRLLGESIKQRTLPTTIPDEFSTTQEFLEYVLEKVEDFPKGLPDQEVADKLNDMDLPMEVWQTAFDFYKKGGRLDKEESND